jgi:hypothetical protein
MTSGIGAKGKPAFNDHARASWHLDPFPIEWSLLCLDRTGGVNRSLFKWRSLERIKQTLLDAPKGHRRRPPRKAKPYPGS